jgi:hypothetical protein
MGDLTGYKATLADMLKMWEAYELHGLDMEGNPFRGEESVRPTAAIVMVLNGHGALRSCLTQLEEYHQNDAARVVVLKAEKGEVTVEVRDDFVRGLTALMAGWFEDAGGVNYVELRAFHERLGPFTMTVQRTLGKTPHEIGDELRAENLRLRGLVRGLQRVGEPLFAGYLKSVRFLTAQALHLIRGARNVLNQAAAFK